jgi:hypothetical protein
MAKVIYRLWKDDNKDVMILPATCLSTTPTSCARLSLAVRHFTARF